MILTKTHDVCRVKTPKLTVVMIHGIASESSTYQKALDYLEDCDSLKEVRFITFDLLGFGKSPKDEELNYNYSEQIEALHNAILKSKIDTPLIIVGHSLGTLIVARYANKYPEGICKLVLISPPIYTEKDLDNPAFAVGIEAFKKAISIKGPKILEEKAFNNSMEKIVLNRNNYQMLTKITIPTILIYGNEDQIIAPRNIPKIVKENQNLSAIKTHGRHSITQDKYIKIEKILEEEINA